MANIAQVVNVLQSMILTDTKGTGHMVLTPTYHVFNMYKDFQEATYLPLDITTDSMSVRGDRTIPLLSASAARTADGTIVLSLANVSIDKDQRIELTLDGLTSKPKTVSGQMLTCKSVTDYNDFDNPERVKPAPFTAAKLSKDKITIKVPAKTIAVLKIK